MAARLFSARIVRIIGEPVDVRTRSLNCRVPLVVRGRLMPAPYLAVFSPSFQRNPPTNSDMTVGICESIGVEPFNLVPPGQPG